MNCRKVNHQQKSTFIMCKQLNWPVLKSLKPSCLGQNRKKTRRAGPGPKFCISFQAGPGSGQNFNFPFGPSRAQTNFNFSFGPWAQAEIFFFTSGRARSEKSGPCRPLVCIYTLYNIDFILFQCMFALWILDAQIFHNHLAIDIPYTIFDSLNNSLLH